MGNFKQKKNIQQGANKASPKHGETNPNNRGNKNTTKTNQQQQPPKKQHATRTTDQRTTKKPSQTTI
jgi:hypothetical protein